MLSAALAALIGYLILGFALARSLPERPSTVVRYGVFLVVGLHCLAHALRWRELGGPDLQFFAALSLVSAGMAALSGWAGIAQRLDALGILVYPLAAVNLGLYAAFGSTPAGASSDWPIRLHASLALLAYATLAIGSLLAIGLWVQERALRQHRLGGWQRALPPLVQLETLLFRTLVAGFGLLTLALATGVVFVSDLLAQHLWHKTVFTALSWLVFGALLLGRWRQGWRGPRAVRLTLLAMGLLAVGYFGSRFVLDLVLQRA
jgi:ABC-type uncharacterized transport system permease subunit